MQNYVSQFHPPQRSSCPSHLGPAALILVPFWCYATPMKFPATSNIAYDAIMVTKKSEINLLHFSGPWENNTEALKPFWNKPALTNLLFSPFLLISIYRREREPSTGFVTFSLTDGPEYHISRSDSLCFLTSGRANRETRGETCTLTYLNFEEIYDFEKFIRSLGVVVRVAKDLPAEVSTGELKAVWVLNRASEDYMAAKIEPVFRTKRKLRLATYLPSITMRRAEDSRYSDLLA
ncbi:hypothetical protein AAG906_020349 [Vitis piasezkii]